MTAVADRSLQASDRSSLWMALAAPALILVTSIAQYMNSHGYNLMLPESLMLLAVSAVSGVAIGALSRLRPVTLEPLLLAVLLMAYVSKQPQLSSPLWSAAGFLGSATGVVASVLGFFAVLAVIAFLVCWVLRRHLPAMVSTVFGAMLLATVLLPQQAGGQPVHTGALAGAGSDAPPIIHIILDEHIGLAGLPPDIEGSTEASDILRSTFRDFVVHSHAYSRFVQTTHSLASLMSGESGPDLSEVLSLPQDSHKYRINRNAWFARLRARGYAISVYQTNYLDFCSDVNECYSSSGSISSIQQTPLTIVQRMTVILGSFLHPGWPNMHPLASMQTLHRFMREVEQRPRGTAHILHLMLPHFGFLYNEDCSIVNPTEWGNMRDRSLKEQNSPSERTLRYQLYLPQLACVSRKMDELFDILRRLGVYDEATIIVHGDHGSRLGERRGSMITADSLSQRDMIDHFSTLLAVKTPHTVPSVNTTPIAVQAYFAEQFLDIAPPVDLEDTVFVREPDTKFKARKIRWPNPLSTASKPLTPRP